MLYLIRLDKRNEILSVIIFLEMFKICKLVFVCNPDKIKFTDESVSLLSSRFNSINLFKKFTMY